MVEFIKIVIYVLVGGVVLFGVIPLMLHVWGAMFMKGIMTSYYKLLNQYKNGKEKKK